MLVYPLVLREHTIYLMEAAEPLDFDSLDNPDYLDGYGKKNQSLLKTILWSLGGSLAGALTKRMFQDFAKGFWTGLGGDEKGLGHQWGNKLGGKLRELWDKTVGKASEKVGKLISEWIKKIGRYFKSPIAKVGALLTLVGGLFLAVSKARVKVPSSDVAKAATPGGFKALVQKLQSGFKSAMSDRFGRIGIVLTVSGLILIAYGAIKG